MFIIIEKKSVSVVKSQCLFIIFALCHKLNHKAMKRKFTLILLLLMAFILELNAQQIVSTEPQKRNVLIEEFTGILCPNCPDGHRIANNITSAYPDQVWAVNIHSYGAYAAAELQTEDGLALRNGLGVTGFPGAHINRTSESSLGRDTWAANTVLQLDEDAECNVGGQAYVDLESRKVSIDVEVYYTEDSKATTNYINVIMLQDDIIAYQSGYSSNPSQVVGQQYRHMHAFRDAITPTWGDAISPTTKNSFVTKNYEYTIPKVIGNVDVDIDNVYFIAFVTEQNQGVTTRPILNVNKLTSFTGSSQDVYAYISNVSVKDVLCANEKILKVNVVNGGAKDISTIDFKYSVDGGDKKDFTWSGNASSHEISLVEIPVEVAEGEHSVTVEIVKANGVEISSTETVHVVNKSWVEVVTEADTEEFTLKLEQDKYGNQITWELIASDYSVIKSGGPYKYLSGSSATQSNEEKFTVSLGECVQFIIRDSEGNGICCKYGEGYYEILDSKGNVVVDGAGDFGSEASHVISVVEPKADDGEDDGENIDENNSLQVKVYPNPTNHNLNVNANSMTRITLINTLGQIVYDKEADGDKELLDVSQYETGVYMLRIMTEEDVAMKRVVIN